MGKKSCESVVDSGTCQACTALCIARWTAFFCLFCPRGKLETLDPNACPPPSSSCVARAALLARLQVALHACLVYERAEPNPPGPQVAPWAWRQRWWAAASPLLPLFPFFFALVGRAHFRRIRIIPSSSIHLPSLIYPVLIVKRQCVGWKGNCSPNHNSSFFSAMRVCAGRLGRPF